MKEYFIWDCPKCGGHKIIINHIVSARLLWWYYLECEKCHYCGKPKLFKARAINAWEREARKHG